MSQCAQVYAHMRDIGTITPLTAFRFYGILALHSRVSELRGRGHKIITRMVKRNGKRVGQYRLA